MQTAAQPAETDEKQMKTKQQAKFDPTDWMDSVNEEPETPKPLRCLTALNFVLNFFFSLN